MGTKGEPYFPINTEITDVTTGTTYIIKKLIGRGAYAQCFLAMADNQPYALKVVQLTDLKGEQIKQKLQTEIEIHCSISHPNIVKMHRSFKTAECVFMVLELCERGALDDLLKRNGRLKERHVSKFVAQLVGALHYMHEEKSIVHRDLKLGNIFLDGQLNIKIGDFGLSAIISGNEKRKTVCGTPNYIAPEVLFGKASGHSFEADIWSLGVIIYTLLIGKTPFQERKVEEIYKRIGRNEYIFPQDITLSSDAISLITHLLTTNPDDRLTLDEISQHRFLTHRENLAYRMYRNILSGSYTVQSLPYEHTIFSIPVTSLNGIGYVLYSGICGIYYQDMTNTFIKSSTFVVVRLNASGDRKVFVTEEHLLDNIPEVLNKRYRNILYFIRNYTTFGYLLSENIQNKAGCPLALNIKKEIEAQGSFVAKIKKIKDGLLFVMTNNIFIFDFTSGIRVAVAKDGQVIHAFNDDGAIPFSSKLVQLCADVLRPYCSNR